jgi:hypothetical protein
LHAAAAPWSTAGQEAFLDMRADPPTILETGPEALDTHGNILDRIHRREWTGVVVRGAFPEALIHAGVEHLAHSTAWTSPNRGMAGGEIRTIGDAATPTFDFLRGPPVDLYAQSAHTHAERSRAVFGDAEAPLARVKALLSGLAGGAPAEPPHFDATHAWAAFNFRALDPGQQIYAHHDDHYGLAVYERLPADLDRTMLLSFFITLQAPEAGGELLVYGLTGKDPEVPYLSTRFIDTEAVEARFAPKRLTFAAGDLVVFDAGRHVHRVSTVGGARPRMTFGGFLTLALDRSRVAFWS